MDRPSPRRRAMVCATGLPSAGPRPDICPSPVSGQPTEIGAGSRQRRLPLTSTSADAQVQTPSRFGQTARPRQPGGTTCLTLPRIWAVLACKNWCDSRGPWRAASSVSIAARGLEVESRHSGPKQGHNHLKAGALVRSAGHPLRNRRPTAGYLVAACSRPAPDGYLAHANVVWSETKRSTAGRRVAAGFV